MIEAYKKWNVPINIQMAFIKKESDFVKNALPPFKKNSSYSNAKRISSAYGYSQALDGTWSEYKNSTRNYNARRDNFNDSVDFIGWYLSRASKALNIPKNDALNLYLAYNQGISGYYKKSYIHNYAIINYAKSVRNWSNIYARQIYNCR